MNIVMVLMGLVCAYGGDTLERRHQGAEPTEALCVPGGSSRGRGVHPQLRSRLIFSSSFSIFSFPLAPVTI